MPRPSLVAVGGVPGGQGGAVWRGEGGIINQGGIGGVRAQEEPIIKDGGAEGPVEAEQGGDEEVEVFVPTQQGRHRLPRADRTTCR